MRRIMLAITEKAQRAHNASRQLPEEQHTRAERRDEVMSDPPAFDPETYRARHQPGR